MKGTSSPIVTDFAKLKNDVVFNAELTDFNTFQDLDLSAYVGANAALCFFEMLPDGGMDFVMKPKGYGGVFGSHNSIGVSAAALQGNKYTYLICFTNNAGIVEIAADTSAQSVSIRLVGLIK